MIRVALAWLVYGIGDLFWRFGANAWPGNHWQWPYRCYSQLMIWSDDLQGDDPRGPWGNVDEAERVREEEKGRKE